VGESVAALSMSWDQLSARFDQLSARFDQLSARFDQLGVRLDQLGVRLDQLGVRLDQLGVRFLSSRSERLSTAQGAAFRATLGDPRIMLELATRATDAWVSVARFSGLKTMIFN